MAMHDGKARPSRDKQQQTVPFLRSQGHENVHELLRVDIFLPELSREVDRIEQHLARPLRGRGKEHLLQFPICENREDYWIQHLFKSYA